MTGCAKTNVDNKLRVKISRHIKSREEGVFISSNL
jgi:hypothetical protein